MKRKITITILMLFPVIFHPCLAQNNELKFNLVENPSGKPLGKITSITQDPSGYMWFAGQGDNCIYRYDGNRMTSFSQDSAKSNSLGGQAIETIYADDSGMIWIGFQNGDGIDKYNPGTGIFTHYRHNDSILGSLSDGVVFVMLRDRQGRIWVGTQTGLDRLDELNGKFIHYKNEPGNAKSLSCNTVRTIFEDNKGVIWIGTGFPWDKEHPEDGGLNRLEPDGTFTRFLHDPKNPQSLINNKVRAIFEDSRGVFWVGTSGDGLHTMNRETGSFERHLYDPAKPDKLSRPPLNKGNFGDHITFIKEDGVGAIWIGTEYEGLNRYDAQTKQITHYEFGNGFPDRSGWGAFTSRDGVMWISTEQNHLFRVDPFRKNIYNNTIGALVHCFYEEKDGTLWVGTDGFGLQQYDKNKKLLHQFNIDAADSFGLFSNDIFYLKQNQGDTIWLGTIDGIGTFNKLTKRFQRFMKGTKNADLFINWSGSFCQGKNGLKWFGTSNGLIRYNPQDNSIKQYLPDSKNTGSLSSSVITNVLEDQHGNIWVGTWLNGGVNLLKTETEQFKHYMPDANITSVFEDSKGSMWTGTDKGLFLYNKISDSFSLYTGPKSEIGADFVNGIIEDNVKNLWISMPANIVKLDPSRKTAFLYGKKYGISPGLGGGVYKNPKGELYIGHQNGFYAFSPDELPMVNQSLQIVITDLFINNKPSSAGILKNLLEESKIAFDHSEKNITIFFAAIDYRAPETNKYFTMLEGYDSVWREAGGEKSAFYLNLPPKKYVFRIKAYNSDGVKAEKSIQIIIYPPWWKTWWAYSIYGVLVLIAVFFIDQMQKQRIIRRERQKTQQFELAQAKEIEKAYHELRSTQAQLIHSEKMASLGELTAGIAHEIQNPLNFVNNFSDVNTELIDEAQKSLEQDDKEESKKLMSAIRENEEKIKYHGSRADAIVKSMLQHSRTNTGQKEPTDINALADEYLRLAYHGLRAKDKSFNAELKTDLDPAVGKVNIISQDIGRVLLNLYNNAFYAVLEKQKINDAGFEPTVSISTKKTGNKILISVKDNGNGIPKQVMDKIFQPFFTTKPTGQGTGLGLSLSYDIVKAHNGEITVESNTGEADDGQGGTIFKIELPL